MARSLLKKWRNKNKRTVILQPPRARHIEYIGPDEVVLDADALIAMERGDRQAWTRIKAAQIGSVGKRPSTPVSHGGVDTPSLARWSRPTGIAG